MGSLNGKKILIFQQRGWGMKIGQRLAEKLENEGVKLAALTIKKTTHKAIVNSATKYEIIFNADSVKEDPKKYIEGYDISLEDVCKNLGVLSIWDLVQASRYHVKSYKDKYYFGFNQNLSDREIKDYVIAIYKYIAFIFEQFSPEVIITPNFAGLQHIMFNLYSKKNGVTMLGCVDSKIPNITILTTSYLADSGRFFDYLDELNNGVVKSNYKDAQNDLNQIKNNFLDSSNQIGIAGNVHNNLWQNLKLNLIPFARLILFFSRRRKNRLKNQNVTLDDQTPYYILRDYFQGKINAWNADKYAEKNLDYITNYVYFPLQVQPEATIDIFSPRFNNQIETARQIAMSLPNDYILVVKDHPSMRRKRPSSYLRKISKLPNVILVGSNISTKSILMRARMVIATGGTTIYQAALLSKPVIQLGNLGTTLKLPWVYHHSDFSTLSKKIQYVENIIQDEHIWSFKMKNYISAANEVGFDLDYYEIAENFRQGTTEELDLICNRFIKEIKEYI